MQSYSQIYGSGAKELITAAAIHDMDSLKWFIEVQGLAVDATYDEKPTALCYSLIKPNHCMMKYLIYHGADIMHSDGLGMTPLHYAALGGCEYCVSYLISLGAQINHETKNGKTPLALIENRENQNSCCEYLERNGACTVAKKIPIKKMH